MNELDAKFIKSSVTAMHNMAKSKDAIHEVHERIQRRMHLFENGDADQLITVLAETLYSSLEMLGDLDFSPVISKEEAQMMTSQLRDALTILSRVCNSAENTLIEGKEAAFSELINYLSDNSSKVSGKSEPAGICVEDDDDDEEED